MINNMKENECCGCTACINICPVKCLGEYNNELGFSYPIMENKDACIECKLCEKVCPTLKEIKTKSEPINSLCAYAKNNDIKSASTSGGIFTLLANKILDDGGYVYGAALITPTLVKHIEVSSAEELWKLQGSKYIESKLGDIFLKVKEKLQTGKKVLFSGVPCQIYGLLSFLGKEYDNLICIDLLCYGVPSPRVWSKYLSFINKENKDIKYINFRDKTYGWKNYSLKITYEDGSHYLKEKNKDLFLSTYSKGGYIKSYCYTCKMKGFPKKSDITLGDFLEVDRLDNSFNDDKGMSAVFINTSKGQKLYNEIINETNYLEVTAEKLNEISPRIGAPSKMHKKRERIIKEIDNIPIDIILKKYAMPTKVERVKNIIRILLRKMGLWDSLNKILEKKKVR